MQKAVLGWAGMQSSFNALPRARIDRLLFDFFIAKNGRVGGHILDELCEQIESELYC